MKNQTLLSENKGCGDGLWRMFFIAVAVILYWQTRHAGFVTDWFGWQAKYESGSFRDALASMGYRALHPVLHCSNFLIFKLFGTKTSVWFVIFATLHGLNGWLIYNLVRRLVTIEGGKSDVFPPLVAALLFLVCPFNAEPMVWRVCLHYLLCGFFFLKAISRLLDFLETDDKTAAALCTFWMACVFLTFEWTAIAPILMVIFSLAFLQIRGGWQRLPRIAGLIFLPNFALFGCWLLANRHFWGTWVGHYGEATHLNFSPSLIASTTLKYFVKHFALARYFEHPVKSRIFDGCDSTAIWGIGWAVLLAAAAAFFYFFKKHEVKIQWGGVALLCFFVSLLPVANLYFYYLDWSENDRYGYFASIFGGIALALLLSKLRWAYPILIAAFGLASAALLLRTGEAWRDNALIFKSLRQSFRWQDSEEVIILASPDNFKGTFLNRIIGQENGFSEPLNLIEKKPFRGKRMLEVVQFAMTKPSDAVRVEQVDSAGLEFKISFAQDGNWFMRNGIGATDYETDRYFFKKREWDALLILKEKRAGSVLIYPVGGQWLEMK